MIDLGPKESWYWYSFKISVHQRSTCSKKSYKNRIGNYFEWTSLHGYECQKCGIIFKFKDQGLRTFHFLNHLKTAFHHSHSVEDFSKFYIASVSTPPESLSSITVVKPILPLKSAGSIQTPWIYTKVKNYLIGD